MGIILDLLIVLIVAVFVFFSAKKGFVKTAIELVGFFLAVQISFFLGGFLADQIYDRAVSPALTNSIEEKVTASELKTTEDAVNAVWDNLPEFVTSTAGNFGVSRQSVVLSFKSSATNSASAVATATDEIAKPIIVNIIKVILYVVLFSVLSILIKWLAHILNKIFKVSIIGKLNAFLGGFLGLLKGLVIVTAFCILISVCMKFSKDGFFIFTDENVSSSYIFKFLSEII